MSAPRVCLHTIFPVPLALCPAPTACMGMRPPASVWIVLLVAAPALGPSMETARRVLRHSTCLAALALECAPMGFMGTQQPTSVAPARLRAGLVLGARTVTAARLWVRTFFMAQLPCWSAPSGSMGTQHYGSACPATVSVSHVKAQRRCARRVIRCPTECLAPGLVCVHPECWILMTAPRALHAIEPAPRALGPAGTSVRPATLRTTACSMGPGAPVRPASMTIPLTACVKLRPLLHHHHRYPSWHRHHHRHRPHCPLCNHHLCRQCPHPWLHHRGVEQPWWGRDRFP